MKTPEQIRDMEFQKSTMGGYKQSDVELFLEEVASQIEILTKQKNDAERKLQEMSKKAPEAALSASGIQNVLVSAQRVADQVIEEANQSAEKIVADANLKLTEADIKAREIIAEAESKAILLGDTAEKEAAKIIADAVEESEVIIAEAKASVEVEEKLYDRLKIEISDFRKKAAAQTSALLELINQLPGEIPFNMERSKTVLAVDFSDPEALLKAAVEERLAKERAKVEAEDKANEESQIKVTAVELRDEEEIPDPGITVEAPVTEVEVEEPEVEEVIAPEIEIIEADENVQMEFGNDVALTVDVEDEVEAEPEIEEVEEEVAEEDEEEAVPFATAAKMDEPNEKPKRRISFGEEDDDFDDDEDDEPRLFFRRKKK